MSSEEPAAHRCRTDCREPTPIRGVHRRGPRIGSSHPSRRHPDYASSAPLRSSNSQHSKKNRACRFKTMHDRQRMVVSFFRELRHRDAVPQPRSAVAGQPSHRGHGGGWLERRLHRDHPQLPQLPAHVRGLDRQDGMVREPGVLRRRPTPPHAHRWKLPRKTTRAKGVNVDIAAKIAEIARFDHCGWDALELRYRLRPGAREARH